MELIVSLLLFKIMFICFIGDLAHFLKLCNITQKFL